MHTRSNYSKVFTWFIFCSYIQYSFFQRAVAILSLLALEEVLLNFDIGALCAGIHYNYSHSLMGSVILSAICGAVKKLYMPGFSHFSDHQLWLALCLANILLRTRILHRHGVFQGMQYHQHILLTYLHFQADMNPLSLVDIFGHCPRIDRRVYSALIVIFSFCIPAILLGILMTIWTKIKETG